MNEYSLRLSFDEVKLLRSVLIGYCERAQRNKTASRWCEPDKIGAVFSKTSVDGAITSEDFDILFSALREWQSALSSAKLYVCGFKDEVTYLSECEGDAIDLYTKLLAIRYDL